MMLYTVIVVDIYDRLFARSFKDQRHAYNLMCRVNRRYGVGSTSLWKAEVVESRIFLQFPKRHPLCQAI